MEPGSIADEPARTLQRERLLPLARPFHYRGQLLRGQARCSRPGVDATWIQRQPPIFLIGCGRSGTTILGDCLGRHGALHYRYEPNADWAAIDSQTDFFGIYGGTEARTILDADDVTERARRRFARAMRMPSHRTLLEKTPINTLRIGYLNALAPGARFLHIARDGCDVASSIRRYAQTTVGCWGAGALNLWWGVDDRKWHCLRRDALARRRPGDPAGWLRSDLQRGAYEWLLSVEEVARWRQHLGSRLVETTYPALVADPEATLRNVALGLDLDLDPRWLASAASAVRQPSSELPGRLTLPGTIASSFNEMQRQLGFSGRADALSHERSP